MARQFPGRLRIELNALATRVLFGERGRAIGVEYLRGERLYRAHRHPAESPGERCEVRASREVILAGGAFNTPQLLMLSGIGPVDDLRKFDIPVLENLPAVGKNMHEHHHVFISWERADRTTERKDYYRSKEMQAAARAQWEKDQTGKLSEIGCVLGIGWLKSDAVYQSEEFKALPKHRRDHLLK